MILFIHGIQQSAGVFLPLIKEIIGDNGLIEDRLILDSFCLWVPGYDKKDRDFNYKYLEDEIFDFIEQKREIQAEIASKLLLTSTNIPVNLINESKLNIIGCDIGAGISLIFASQNPEIVSSIAMIDCGNNFSTLRSKWMLIKTNRLINEPANVIARRYESETDLYKKNFLSNISTYPTAKGIKSYLKLFKEYNFLSIFDKISIDQQASLAQVKIINLVDKKIGLSNNSDAKKLQKVLDKKFKTYSKNEILINSQNHKKFHIQSVEIGSQSVLNSQVVSVISEKLKFFYS
jgi:hypothetical protein